MPTGDLQPYPRIDKYSFCKDPEPVELIQSKSSINININLSLSDIYSLLTGFDDRGYKRYYKDDEISTKLRIVLNEWLRESNNANSTLPKVPTPPSTPNPAFTYSGPGNMSIPEFQVW